jgi:plastocyanin
VSAQRSAAAAWAALLALAASGCGGTPAPRAHAVRIERFAFQPAELAVSPGDTVVFTNADIAPHTATAADSSWDSGGIERGRSWRLVVPEGGIGDYLCLFHPTMTATLTRR